MSLQEFIKKFDKEHSIVLLEGKRNVLKADEEKLIALGKLLASSTEKMTFRSGNASGSDQLFSAGVAGVGNSRLQVITPYTGHRKTTNLAAETINLDEINLASEPEVVYYSKSNKKTKGLVDQYVSGNKKGHLMKAAYIIRDTVKVIGANAVRPATFGIFYDDLDNPKSGGTGHTMRVCEQNQVPVIDQRTWFDWLTVE